MLCLINFSGKRLFEAVNFKYLRLVTHCLYGSIFDSRNLMLTVQEWRASVRESATASTDEGSEKVGSIAGNLRDWGRLMSQTLQGMTGAWLSHM